MVLESKDWMSWHYHAFALWKNKHLAHYGQKPLEKKMVFEGSCTIAFCLIFNKQTFETYGNTFIYGVIDGEYPPPLSF